MNFFRVDSDVNTFWGECLRVVLIKKIKILREIFEGDKITIIIFVFSKISLFI